MASSLGVWTWIGMALMPAGWVNAAFRVRSRPGQPGRLAVAGRVCIACPSRAAG